MPNIIETIERDGYMFRVEHEYDHDAGCPWEREDGHGSVRHAKANYTGHPDKRPGELVLDGEFLRGGYVYDFADACEQARRDNWGSYGWQGAGEGMTRRQFAAEQARNDYERLRAWCKDEWYYVGVIVTLLDIEGNATDAQQSLWGIESDSEGYLGEVATQLANDCINDVQSRLGYDTDEPGIELTIYSSGSRHWTIKEEKRA